MNSLDNRTEDLVIANRTRERRRWSTPMAMSSSGIRRIPSRFQIARSVSPELVIAEDIVELGLDGRPVGDDKRPLYLERFIHAAIIASSVRKSSVTSG